MTRECISEIDFLPKTTTCFLSEHWAVREVARQLLDYFQNKLSCFSLPLCLRGTSFQQQVWEALQQVKIGEVVTYGQLAKRLGTSARAVGNACRANPVPIIIPCHRIVAANGLGGFMGRSSGAELDLKTWLLGHEKSLF